jgi:hypothetical protein
VELAQGLAARVLREGPPGTSERLRFAFRLCLGREPDAQELKQLVDILGRQRDGSDERPAWVLVSRVLLNLDEFITRE